MSNFLSKINNGTPLKGASDLFNGATQFATSVGELIDTRARAKKSQQDLEAKIKARDDKFAAELKYSAPLGSDAERDTPLAAPRYFDAPPQALPKAPKYQAPQLTQKLVEEQPPNYDEIHHRSRMQAMNDIFGAHVRQRNAKKRAEREQHDKGQQLLERGMTKRMLMPERPLR